MIILILFAFLAGIVTILSPCILPILPIVLSSSFDPSGKWRSFGVVTGFVISFTFFTLFLSTIVQLSGIPAESLRYVSIFILIFFGLSLFIPVFQILMEKLFSALTSFAPSSQNRHGFIGGVVIGLSLGLLWTPCVGPILASVISLALSGTVTFDAALITLAYSLGTAIPMFLIIQGGSTALQKVPWLLQNSSKIQKLFGVLMVLTAIAIFFNLDRRFQSWILDTFPQYGVGLTQLEDNTSVLEQLKNMTDQPMDDSQMGKPTTDVMNEIGPAAPELVVGGEWFNTEPFKLADLKGKVVLVDFWTYSCINCQRTLPYLRKWWSEYKDQGLVIIGVHSPEFEFEKNPQNVSKALKDFEIEYPVMQDNNFATWRAYQNRYWPAKYLIDKNGRVRYTHFGEGAYNETEEKIRELLSETGKELTGQVSNPDYEVYSQTPELYLGYQRMEYLASPERVIRDQLSQYSAPKDLTDNTFAFSGSWKIMPEYSNPQAGATLRLNFEAKEVFLVMKPTGAVPGQIKLTLDGKLQSVGEDVQQGVVNVDTDRLYKLIKLENPGRHLLQLEFLDNNTEIYAFTFG